MVAALPPIYPHALSEAIRRDEAGVGRVLVVLDDDPTGTQTVHSVPVLAEWSVDALVHEVLCRHQYVTFGPVVSCVLSGRRRRQLRSLGVEQATRGGPVVERRLW